MFSFADLFAFLHQAEPEILRLIKDEIVRDLRHRGPSDRASNEVDELSTIDVSENAPLRRFRDA